MIATDDQDYPSTICRCGRVNFGKGEIAQQKTKDGIIKTVYRCKACWTILSESNEIVEIYEKQNN